MSMTDSDEKRNALDHFASTSPMVAAPSVQPMVSPGDRVFGAQQVAVYRDESRILQKLAALGAAAGDDWFYRFPVNNRNGGREFIEGPSIKLANDVARIYGNCEVDTRVLDMGSSWIIYARFTDFETGFALTRPFQQNKSASKMGGKDNDRRLDIAFQIGVSKAIRNVVVNALQTFADHAFSAARNSLIQKIGKDVVKWRNEIITRLKDNDVDIQRVEFVIGRASSDWTAPDVAKIIAMMKAVADGMATVDETFPPKDKQVDETAGEQADAKTDDAAQAEASSKATLDQTTTMSSPQQSSDNAAPDQAAAESSAPPRSKEKAAAKVTGKKEAKADDAAAADSDGASAVPKNEAEYVAHAENWIDALDDAADGEKRWKDEKSIRNKANVGPDVRESLQERLAKKCAEIRDADRS